MMNMWSKVKDAGKAAGDRVAEAAAAAKEATLGPQREIAQPTVIVCDEMLADADIRKSLFGRLELLGVPTPPHDRAVAQRRCARSGEIGITDEEMEKAVASMK